MITFSISPARNPCLTSYLGALLGGASGVTLTFSGCDLFAMRHRQSTTTVWTRLSPKRSGDLSFRSLTPRLTSEASGTCCHGISAARLACKCPPDVNELGNSFKMGWISASSVPAKMVNFQPVRDRTEPQLVHHAMNAVTLAVILEPPVSVIEISLPLPARSIIRSCRTTRYQLSKQAIAKMERQHANYYTRKEAADAAKSA